MVDVFRIEFFGTQTNKGVPAFSAGQQVQARVILKLQEPMKARAIKLHISGKAEVHWTESETTTRRDSDGKTHSDTDTIHYRSNAVYMDQNIVLWTPPDQLIPPVEHIFPFDFTVPPHCPPSFEGDHGHIRYTCSVNIDRPWRFDKQIKSVFVVSPFVDLNTIDWALGPVERQINKSIGFFLCKHGKLTAKIRVPKSGFVPGEEIPLWVEIDNGSSKEVKKVKAKLLENVTFIAKKGPTLHYDLCHTTNWGSSTQHFGQRHSSRKVGEHEKHFKVAAHGKGTFQAQLAIPPCVPTFNTCPIIKIDYQMEVKLETTACLCGTASAQFPILIGTIPIRQNPPHHHQMPPNQEPHHQPVIGFNIGAIDGSNSGICPYPPANLAPSMLHHPQPTAPPYGNASSPLPSAPPPPPYPDGPPPAYADGDEHSPFNPYYKNL